MMAIQERVLLMAGVLGMHHSIGPVYFSASLFLKPTTETSRRKSILLLYVIPLHGIAELHTYTIMKTNYQLLS